MGDIKTEEMRRNENNSTHIEINTFHHVQIDFLPLCSHLYTVHCRGMNGSKREKERNQNQRQRERESKERKSEWRISSPILSNTLCVYACSSTE